MNGFRMLAARVAIVGGLAWVLGVNALAQDDERSKKLRELPWQMEPAVGKIADKATVPLTGLRFLDPGPTDTFMQLTGNLPRQNSYLLGRKDLAWFAVLDFVPDGYVKDDEKIDAAKLLTILKEGNQASGEERKKRGLPSLVLDGWQLPPQYDAENKRLEWATLLHTDGGEKVVNYSTKLLARRGYTSAILVSDPTSFTGDVAEFKAALKAVQYVPGESYTEFKEGDKVAAYGLGALILGGAAAVATKKGLWAVLAGLFGAFWKVIVGVGVAALAGIGSLFKRKSKE
ncbi:MAG: rane protein [Ramlibacter sp.]|nr:rane protein [Ramlibacter sp.]